MADAAVPSPAPTRAMPIFYRDVRPVEATRHAGKGLPARIDYEFAAGTNSVPLNGQEFAFAQRHYPIVFARSGDTLVALALLGLKREENLFVGADGRWATNTYIPGYVRRFPFVFIEAADKRFALAVEESGLIDGGERPLFDAESKPTPLLQGALSFCGTYQRNHGETRAFFDALLKADLLIEQQADAAGAQGPKVRLSGFHVIDPQRWRDLPLETLGAMRAKGWVDWVYAHLFSQINWRFLAQRAGTAA